MKKRGPQVPIPLPPARGGEDRLAGDLEGAEPPKPADEVEVLQDRLRAVAADRLEGSTANEDPLIPEGADAAAGPEIRPGRDQGAPEAAVTGVPPGQPQGERSGDHPGAEQGPLDDRSEVGGELDVGVCEEDRLLVPVPGPEVELGRQSSPALEHRVRAAAGELRRAVRAAAVHGDEGIDPPASKAGERGGEVLLLIEEGDDRPQGEGCGFTARRLFTCLVPESGPSQVTSRCLLAPRGRGRHPNPAGKAQRCPTT